jgi:hypothetical protein
MAERIPTVRISPDNQTVLQNLGLLKELAGNWHGHGFNLVARPAFEFNANLFLELNLTDETLKFDPISSSIPNRGTFQEDIELYGLTYLQKISDATTGGALHIEPGIWITQPATSDPALSPPAGGQIVARMGNIPHGNSVLIGGSATKFTGGPPVLGAPTTSGTPAGSIFPSFNSTPAPVSVPEAAVFAAGTAEFNAKANGGFSEYTLTNAPSGTPPTPNPRTPLGNVPPILAPAITQALVNDPIVLLQNTVRNQIAEGYTFEEVITLNIATQTPISFLTTPPPPTTTPLPTAPPLGPSVSVALAQAVGGAENLQFLQANADTMLVYATFWIEKLTHAERPPMMQLQYAQMVMLQFPAILIAVPPTVPPPLSKNGKLNFCWPHITVSTLHKTFG